MRISAHSAIAVLNFGIMIVDLHTHTSFSHDSDADIDAMCRSAIEKGASVLAFTDHFDVWETHTKKGSTYNGPAAREAILSAKKRYSADLRVLYGIELGEAVEFAEEANALLAENPFEFVIGSLHALPYDQDLFYTWGIRNRSIEEMQAEFSVYLDALAEIAELPAIHTLAHLTYPLRYAANNNKLFDIAPYQAQIDRILLILIRRRIALEINTSGLRQKIGVTLPTVDILKRYYSLGGRLITIGSDAHRPEDVGAGIRETAKTLQAIGFEHVMYASGTDRYFLPLTSF